MPFTFGRMASFGMRTSSRISSLVTLARRLIFLWMSARLEALRVRRDEEAADRSPSSFAPPTFAQTSATCARLPLVIQRFVPLSTQRVAVVDRRSCACPTGFEPESGSVRPKQPMISPFAIFGQVALLLRLGAERVDRVHDERALHAREAADAGVAALELLHREAVADLAQAGAAVARAGCSRAGRARAISGMRSVGNVPFSKWSPMTGSTRASTNARTVLWMARSSGVK